MRTLLRHLLGGLLLAAAAPAVAGSVARTEHTTLSLLSEAAAIAPGQTVWLGVRFDLAPEWHVYWRNPGDSGAAPTLAWSLPEGWRAGTIRWPVPDRIRVGPLTNYGYEGSVTFMVPVDVGPSAVGPAGQPVAVRASWLVCREECIPEEASLDLTLPVTDGKPAVAPAVARDFEAARARWPLELPGEATYRLEPGRLVLEVGRVDWPAARIDDLWFAANDWGPVAASGDQRWATEEGRLRLMVPTGDRPPDGSSTLAGLLVLRERLDEGPVVRGFAVQARPAGGASSQSPGTLLGAVALAFLGGLVLNLMPCVLPVLSLKVMGLVREAGAGRRRLVFHGLLFALGVLASFVLLAGALLLLRAGGEALGWGFQLQSPVVVTLLAYLMLAVALNLSGVYHVGHGLMGLGDGLGSRPGAAGAVASGVLAAVVASPCTAPFMGAALGYALTRPPLEALAVFLALGAGFALPVLSLSLWPAWTRWLPRPGPWTGRLQQVLAFPMYSAAAWLVWVVSQQATPRGLAAVLAGLVAVGLAAWLVGQRQAGWRGSAVAATVSGLIALALVPLAGDARLETPASATAWTPERVEALRREGRPVLVNFTAAWCITCQVNERVALATEAVVEARERKQVAYLKGDWTRRDARISRELERHGRSGVPLYLLYPAGPGAPRVLPPVLTEGTVLDALDAL